MKCREIIENIEKSYSKSYAMEWDNVGLLAGSHEKEVRRIYVALDATDEVIEAAKAAGADLLVTHHPMIFSPVSRITDEDFIGRRLLRMIRRFCQSLFSFSSQERKASQPSSISLQAVSKSPVYQGSSISRGRPEKSSRRRIL